MEVIVRKSEVRGVVRSPPSKSYTHRAFIAASLSPSCRVINPLISEDTLATLNGCKKLGTWIRRGSEGWSFRGVDGINVSDYFNFENSGTTLRIFTGLLSLSTSPDFSILDGDKSLRKRPNKELVIALKKLGADIRSEGFRAPLRVRGVISGGEIEIEAVSSQFISSLLFALPMAKYDSVVKVRKMKSHPYVNITLKVLESSGIKIERKGMEYYIPGQQSYRLRKFTIPADFSSASYLIAAGLIAGEVRITNVFDSEQGDKRIVDICKEMGGNIRWNKRKGIILAKKSELEGIDVDASNIPDLVPTISVLAAVARGKTRIYNAEHLRIKEIDRIEGIATNLRSLGVEVKAYDDGLLIKGDNKDFMGTVNSFGDHRMSLSFSILGLLGEVRCINAEVVSVSFPGFFDVLRSLGADVRVS